MKLGEVIELNTFIQNNFSRDISTHSFYLDDFLSLYNLEILNSQGESLKRIDRINIPRFGSKTALELMSGEKYSSNLQINRFYNLPVGKYSISISLTVLNLEKREKLVVTSNIVKLTVVE